MTWRSPLALNTAVLCLAIGVIAGCAPSYGPTIHPTEATLKSSTQTRVYDVPLPSATAHRPATSM